MSQAQTNQPENDSKDAFFREIAELSERMIAAHGKEFSMGVLVLAARFIAESKPFTSTLPDLQ
ncbi:hypothetical protein QO001_005605 [Methylobacterium brachiatum]|uniref:Uncharacterized protein n=1 Tax=Methylobacterium brachiatum TaxID=269660 RepID=A0AAJ1TZN0_9HYPH|nr:hypothetical protein [Methylobacterium brachiatum]MCB4806197.1 hypothetical protein [Methylobacterium brachiatum]MDQ0546653.1 hypothetical protein [Methylobacterium brachiatum]